MLDKYNAQDDFKQKYDTLSQANCCCNCDDDCSCCFCNDFTNGDCCCFCFNCCDGFCS